MCDAKSKIKINIWDDTKKTDTIVPTTRVLAEQQFNKKNLGIKYNQLKLDSDPSTKMVHTDKVKCKYFEKLTHTLSLLIHKTP